MRKGALKASLPKDVCVFCATRLQNLSAKRSLRPQRRLFASTGVARKPPVTAPVQKEVPEGDSGWAKWEPPKEVFQPQNTGRTSGAGTDSLMPEEKALRDTLRSQARKKPQLRVSSATPGQGALEYEAPPQSKTPIEKAALRGQIAVRTSESETNSARTSRPDALRQPAEPERFQIRFGRSGDRPGKQIPRHQAKFQRDPKELQEEANRTNGIYRPSWACRQCSFLNHSQQEDCKICKAIRPESLSWVCQKCSATHDPLQRSCYRCRGGETKLDLQAKEETDEEAPKWQHLRRKTASEVREGEKDISAYPKDGSDGRTNAHEHQDKERRKRFENAKSGVFVPLRGLQKSKRAFQDTNPEKQPPESAHQVERPLFRRTARRDSDTDQPLARNLFANDSHQGTQSKDRWASYEPKTTEESSAEVQERKKSYEEIRRPTLYKPMMSSSANPAFMDSLQSDEPKQKTSQESSFTIRKAFAEDRFTGKQSPVDSADEPYGEIKVARSYGRSTAPKPFDGGYSRRKERNQRSASRIEENDRELDDETLAEKRAARKAKIQKAKERQKNNAPPTPIFLPEFISVSNLAGVLKVRVEDFLRKMQNLGFEGMSNDHVLDAETAGLVASEYHFEPIIDRSEERDLKPQPSAEDKSVLPARPPVVTIMGHVDHGKTTLLDFLRKSSVAASEHGGITQHIGAFSVPMSGGRLVTFLDTPGHAAFLSMRQRGANVTDIVILVVAADDSVKPQTIEAIKHAQAAKVPIIVAINKIDKDDANAERVKQDLSRHGVEIEDFGGDTQVVCVSGKTGQGMAELEDAAVALADILDVRAETDGLAEGWVLEATTKRAGRVATILVRRGTIHPGDVIVAGTSWARVRSLRNEAGVIVESAGPGTPVEIDGWREQPAAGDEVLQAPNNDEQRAKSVVDYRLETFEREQLAKDMNAVNESRRIEHEKRDQIEKAKELANTNPDADPADRENVKDAGPQFHEVFFITKADVSGSVEAVTNAVSALGTPEVRPHILRAGVGSISEFDVDHAAVASGHIINFNTHVDGSIQRIAEEKGVKILDQSIIYRLVDDVKKVLEEKLPPTVTQKVLGEAEIAQRFEINVKGRVTVPVAGCRVRNGEVGRRERIRVLRGGQTVYDGTLSSLKNVKKDITEARKGTECGMGFENWTEFEVGDQVQAYEEKSERRTL